MSDAPGIDAQYYYFFYGDDDSDELGAVYDGGANKKYESYCVDG